MNSVPTITIQPDEFETVEALADYIKETVYKNNIATIFRLLNDLRVAAMVYPDHDAFIAIDGGDWKPFDLRNCAYALLIMAT